MERQTTFARPGQTPAQWHLVDAEDQVLGRLATRIATILMGKHTPRYTPHVDTGDFVVVVNAGKIKLTGRKLEQKFEKRFSGYPGGLKQTSYGVVLQRHPERLVYKAVQRMLPKTSMGRKMLGKLKVYAGPDHPHQAQQPVALKLD